MDGLRFDDMVRSLAVARSRRTVLGLAVMLGIGGIGTMVAKRKRKKKKKKAPAQPISPAPLPPPAQPLSPPQSPPSGCAPNCSGRVCGSDGCTGSCGSCPQGKGCNFEGQCVDTSPTNTDPICAGVSSCCPTRQCGNGCSCQSTIEGGGFCFQPGATGCGETCTSSAECEDGVCVFYGTATTCGGQTCCAGRTAVCVPNSSRCTSAG